MNRLDILLQTKGKRRENDFKDLQMETFRWTKPRSRAVRDASAWVRDGGRRVAGECLAGWPRRVAVAVARELCMNQINFMDRIKKEKRMKAGGQSLDP